MRFSSSPVFLLVASAVSGCRFLGQRIRCLTLDADLFGMHNFVLFSFVHVWRAQVFVHRKQNLDSIEVS